MNATADIKLASSRDGEVRTMLDDSVEAARQRVKDSRAALDDARADYKRAASRMQSADAAHTDALFALDAASAAAESTAA